MIKPLIISILYIAAINVSMAKSNLFTYKGPESKEDQRFIYMQKVLELALNKTKSEYGDFELQATTEGINQGRLLLQMDKNVYSNYFFRVSVTDELLENYHVIKFPIDRGISGYRVAFTNSQRKKNYCLIKNKEGISKAIIAQGIGWLDTDILKHNGLNVYAIANYKSIFEMLSLDRVDLFFRGINEIKAEYEIERVTYPNLVIEPCIALYYPLPRFFVTDKQNINNANRIEKGLKIAFEDGSFIMLWEEYFRDSIELVNLQSRTLIKLDNPYIQNLDSNFEKYNYPLPEKLVVLSLLR
ncbi:hypothetical protein [Paraglaciecola arctica]|uniref:Solute-binding protein family 3/N-terminal domain-containing protein n=1 Tax=Paraglaciecola arctica BSs20135 TaxID=493475 RepID=K6YDK6_9ALTE|nr:hypothetical protein [Paraglaciecola arctica]GAC22041.1 hypothetical protein GARC_5106 [Paraglaciecola arctica BSs20135]